jgi:hypothetical protein
MIFSWGVGDVGSWFSHRFPDSACGFGEAGEAGAAAVEGGAAAVEGVRSPLRGFFHDREGFNTL